MFAGLADSADTYLLYNSIFYIFLGGLWARIYARKSFIALYPSRKSVLGVAVSA